MSLTPQRFRSGVSLLNPKRGFGKKQLFGSDLTDAISMAMVDLYADFYEHSRTTATTHINGKVVVCVLENILSAGETDQIDRGGSGDVIDARVAFQNDTEDEFTLAVETLTNRSVTSFLSANQATPGVACELFILEDVPPLEPVE